MTQKEFHKRVIEMFDETEKIIEWRRKQTQREINTIKLRYKL